MIRLPLALVVAVLTVVGYGVFRAPFGREADRVSGRRVWVFIVLIFLALSGCGPSPTTVQSQALSHHDKGLEHFQAGEFSEAIEEFTKAIDIGWEPEARAIALTMRAYAYGQKGDMQQAIKDYTEAIEQAPTLTDAYLGRGHTYNGLEQWEEAINDFSQALELEPNLPAIYASRGNAYNSLEQWEKAIEDFDKAIALETKTPSESQQIVLITSYKGRGHANVGLGNDELARQDFETVLTLDPNDPEADDIKKILELLKPQSTKPTPNDSLALCEWFTESQLIRAERTFGLEKYVTFYRKYGPEGFESNELSIRNELVDAVEEYLPYEQEFIEKWEQLGSTSEAKDFWEKELEAAKQRLAVFEKLVEAVKSEDKMQRDAVVEDVTQVNLIERESNAAMLEVREKCLS